jgi:hypothetical protein
VSLHTNADASLRLKRPTLAGTLVFLSEAGLALGSGSSASTSIRSSLVTDESDWLRTSDVDFVVLLLRPRGVPPSRFTAEVDNWLEDSLRALGGWRDAVLGVDAEDVVFRADWDGVKPAVGGGNDIVIRSWKKQ